MIRGMVIGVVSSILVAGLIFGAWVIESGSFVSKSGAKASGGEFVAEPSGANEGVVLADMDLDRIAEIRETWPFFRDRRPGLYGELA